MKTTNPFPLYDYVIPKYFCNRRTETERITSAITNQRNIALFSENGIGKTTLIKHVFFTLSDLNDYKFYFVDLERTETVNDFFQQMIFAIFNKNGNVTEKSLKKIKNTLPGLKFSLLKNKTTSNQNILIESKIKTPENLLKEIIDFVERKNEKTVFAFDNIESLYSALPQNLFEYFKENFLRLNNFNIIFTAANKEYFGKILTGNIQAEIMELKKIDVKKYGNFIKKRFGKAGITIKKEVIEFILNRTKQHTFYTQFVCNKLFLTGEKNITLNIVETVFKNILLENNRTFLNIKHLLSPYQWKLLKAIAKQEKASGITSVEFIEKYELNAPSSVKTAITALLEKQLVYRNRFTYHLTNVFLEKWITEQP